MESRSAAQRLIFVVFAFGWALATALTVDVAARKSFLLWLEHWTGDIRTAMFADRRDSQHPGVVVVSVTDETLTAFPYRTPVDRAFLAKLIKTLDSMQPRAIGLDMLMIHPTEPDKDADLVATLKSTRTPFVIAAADSRIVLTDAERAAQTAFIAATNAAPGYANLLTGGDQVVRHIAAADGTTDYGISFAAALAGANPAPRDTPRRIAWLLKPKDNSDTFLTLPAHLIQPPSLPAPSPTANALARFVKDRIILIGADLPDIDRHLTPLPEWEGEEVPGVMLHAQAVAQMLDGREITPLRREVLMWLYGLLALIGAWIGERLGLLAYSALGGSMLVLIAGIDIALFVLTRQFLPFGACAIAVMLGMIGGVILKFAFNLIERRATPE
ncbi:MAG: CHASE2 domain-containing protein [Pseudomonadota bacterium]